MQRLPDFTGALHPGGGHARVPTLENQTLFAADAVRDRYVTVSDHAPPTVRRAMAHRMIRAFHPPSATSSLTVVPKDGTILGCGTDGTLSRQKVPE